MADEYINYNEEESLGKAYDSRLMMRLLKYARPYWKFFALAAFLLLSSTLADLARPYLVKVAIDDYINGYTRPMVAYPPGSGHKGIEFGGKVYQRLPSESLSEKQTGKDIHQIIYIDDAPFLVNGIVSSGDKARAFLIPDRVDSPNRFRYVIGNKHFPAIRLSKDDISLFRSGDIQAVGKIAVIFIAILLLSFIFNVLQIYVLSYTGQTIIYNIRQKTFSHLQKMSQAFFDKNPVGRLVTRVTNDTEALNDMYTNVLVSLLKDIFLLAGTIIIMLKLNAKLTLIVLLTIPILIPVTILFRIKARAVYRQVRVTLAAINSTISENISGMRIIQIFNREREKLEEFKVINNRYKKAIISEVIVSGLFRPLIEMIAGLVTALIIWYAGGKVMSNVLEFGVMYALLNYFTTLFQPINDLAEKYNILQSAMASSERIFTILDTPPEPDDGELCHDNGFFNRDIEFKNVKFAYKENEWVLKDISFTVPSGKTVAIVGATGAGKTSIINLINRFYEIQEGEILVGGTNIKNIKKECLRKNIGVVLQDVFLFSGSVRDNIKLNENISESDLIKVSEYVNASKFIQNLPSGYDEEVMERGATFSSGQRQLLAFARALAFNPSILILDEATANIDTETELLIQDALSKLTKNRTTIVIAHRLSTIQHADSIIVMHKGRIREMGSHQELLAKRGMYHNLYKLQYKPGESI